MGDIDCDVAIPAVPQGSPKVLDVLQTVLEFADPCDIDILVSRYVASDDDVGPGTPDHVPKDDLSVETLVPNAELYRNQDVSECALVTRELASIPTGDMYSSIRQRIEYLEGISATVSHHISELAQSRHSDLVSASICAIQSRTIKAIYDREVTCLRNAFDAYSASSLRNGMTIPRSISQITSLHKINCMLSQMSRCNALRNIVRSHRYDSIDRIVAAAAGIDIIDTISTSNYATRWKLVAKLREWFKIRLRSLISSSISRLGISSGFLSSATLLHTLGIHPKEAAGCILAEYRRSMFGIVLSTLQRYVNADGSYTDSSSPRPGSHDIAYWARILGPNMVLLTICKILGDLIAFLSSIVQDLGVCQGTGGTTDLLKPYYDQLFAVPFEMYHKSVRDMIAAEFSTLRAYASMLITDLLSNVNIAAATDRGDYLKLSLLLRYFVIVQTVSMEFTVAPGSDIEQCLVHSPFQAMLHSHAREVLDSLVDKFQSSVDGTVTLEDAIHSRLLAPYMDYVYRDTVERIKTCALKDTGERIWPECLSRSNALCSIEEEFTRRVRENTKLVSGIPICSLNPYNGWTPNSPFLGVTIDTSLSNHVTKQYANVAGNGYIPAPVLPGGNEDASSIPEDEWDYLKRHFGPVWTLSSYTFWMHIHPTIQCMALQPNRAGYYVGILEALFDYLLLQRIRECQVHPEQLEFPTLMEFIIQCHSKGHDITPIADTDTTVSILAKRVNAVESMDSLLVSLNKELGKIKLDDIHQRVITELRAAVYPRCMLSLLYRKMPTEAILQKLQNEGTMPQQTARDIMELVSHFVKHVNVVQDFVDNADKGSIPMPIRALLWKYGRAIVTESIQPLIQHIKQYRIQTVVTIATKNGCEMIQKRCEEIYNSYCQTVSTHTAQRPQAITHLSAYESMSRDISNQWT
ncbi:uncharacterized protein BBOV_IV000540 [Babesia bovis T2Bo]|uniref:Uncharacterized protein n=1 Tax=Babesia bovis TaxID=5865 RepID=A7AV28_BABBO|nr:uncharacterized protein BBOV_IV000540 [Babesia bovis T2Bo]EDO05654.1 hypothetical protein BBOV_IV000540 [Babesia bovis T2Bo]|eukprot:XP_001609222.1 hypothetical protein [Babesia bovis T2Bo]